MVSLPTKSYRWAFDYASWQPTDSEILQAFSCIQHEEKERIGRFVFKRDAKASLIGRLLIRKFVFENTNVPYNQIILKRDDYGKPYLDNAQFKNELKFSISHHQGLVVFVGHLENKEIGVDVMTVKYEGGKSLDDFFRLMSRHFTNNEWDIIKNTSSSSEIKMQLFNRYWALKESYVKAVGTGITVDLKKLEFKIKTNFLKHGCYCDDTELFIDSVKQSDWIFQETLLQPKFLVSIAVQGTENFDRNPFTFLRFDEIMKNSVPLLKNDIEFCTSFMQKEEEPF